MASESGAAPQGQGSNLKDHMEPKGRAPIRSNLIRLLLTAYIAEIEGKRMRASLHKLQYQGDARIRKLLVPKNDESARRYLVNLGLLEEREEPTASGYVAKYLCLTEKGRQVVQKYLERYLEGKTMASIVLEAFKSYQKAGMKEALYCPLCGSSVIKTERIYYCENCGNYFAARKLELPSGVVMKRGHEEL